MLVPYLDGMRSWMRGNLDWSRQTPRYNHDDVSQYCRPQDYLEEAVLGVAAGQAARHTLSGSARSSAGRGPGADSESR